MHVQRIETGGTGRGIPDFNACCEGTEFWVELKVVNSGKKIGLRPNRLVSKKIYEWRTMFCFS